MKSYKLNSAVQKQKSGIKWGWIIIFFIIIFIIAKISFGPVTLERRVVITKGDGMNEFIEDLSSLKQLGLKVRMKLGQSELDLGKISEGNYNFTGKYTQIEFLNKIAEGPKAEYQRYTVLEGWSIYDIDYDLTNKGFINEGEYIEFVTNQTYISRYQERYEFLSKAGSIDSMEGFLYPDTYNLDIEGNFIDQLVYLQLDNFNNKVWGKYSSQVSKFSKLSRYEIVILASIVEKEEKSSANRPTVAGIFINRLAKNMMLGADITLCYGLQQPYETCTPSLIAQKVGDKDNPFNTRQNYGIPTQPIANPSVDSISSVLNHKDTDYLYYLHDNSGVIHYGKTLDEHNSNKAKYL